MNFDSEIRAPLEFTKSSKKQITLVCPNCKYSRTISISTVGVICCKCDKYFSSNDSLLPSEAIGTVNTTSTIDTEFTKKKAQMEKDACEWHDKQIADGKLGRSFEPDGEERKW